MGLNQEEMGKKLDLEKTYISQLECARKPLSDYILEKAENILREFKKSKGVKGEEMREGVGWEGQEVVLRGRSHQHLDQVLDGCKHDAYRLAWTYEELKRRFPLRDKAEIIAEEFEQEAIAGNEHKRGDAGSSVPKRESHGHILPDRGI